MASELDQPRLLGVQLQAELRESFAQLSPQPLRVFPVLETHHEVIGLCRVASYAERRSGSLAVAGFRGVIPRHNQAA
jgi:hypothetical protein